MRRFIASLAGKVLSHMVVVALLVWFFSTSFVVSAVAQAEFQPSMAVAQFTVSDGLSASYGQTAGDAIHDELAKTGKFRVIPTDQVHRQISTMGLSEPLAGTTNILRVGQELRVGSIVSGGIYGARVENVAGGRQAKVAMQVVVYDVASGLPVNGAVVTGVSTVRSGNVSDQTLINDAIQAGAADSVLELQQHQLPNATVLNTLTDRCYINQGSRAGFKNGQTVVLSRGREQVATGRIADLEPDEATVIIERQMLGVAPGDHVRAVFPIPQIDTESPFSASGNSPRLKRQAKSGNNSGLVTLLAVVGLAAVLLGSSGGNTGLVTDEVVAEPAMYPIESNGPTVSVRVSWRPNLFAKGNSQRAAWQVWRSDRTDAPVAVTSGDQTNVFDLQYAGAITQYTNWTQLTSVTGGATPCVGTFQNETIPTGLPSLQPGHPYIYSVELVYVLSQIDTPIVQTNTSGGGGNTAGGLTAGGTGGTGTGVTATATGGGTTGIGGTNTTGTNTTGNTGTTGTGTTSGNVTLCYFVSPRQSSKGTATPLPQPVILNPAQGGVFTNSPRPSFAGSVRDFPTEIDYVVQFSAQSDFPRNSSLTYTYGTIKGFGAGTASSGPTIPLPSLTLRDTGVTKGLLPPKIQGASPVFWRIGARAANDRPGPVKDPQTHLRYIFSQPSFFVWPSTGGTPSATSHTTTKAKH
ncbi:MAG TPA: hypothetical protein VG944_10645 [Fimbriimonas sp.]|nr:hypothetical protein [Fimbriimonas sp.]